MKWYLIPLILIMDADLSSAQLESQVPKTNIEEFLANESNIVVRVYYQIGRIGGLMSEPIEVIAVFVYQNGYREEGRKGIRIEIGKDNPKTLQRKEISYVDIDEMPLLLEAFSGLQKLAVEWEQMNKQDYNEAQYETKGDFRIGFYRSEGKYRPAAVKAFASAGTVRTTIRFLKLKDLGKLSQFMVKGLEKLESL